MEIHNQPAQGPRPIRRNAEEAAIDITRPNREGIQKSTDRYLEAVRSLEAKEVRVESHRAEHQDEIKLSSDARLLSRAADERPEADAKIARERVIELRAQYADGSLNTQKRVERAAERILGAD